VIIERGSIGTIEKIAEKKKGRIALWRLCSQSHKLSNKAGRVDALKESNPMWLLAQQLIVLLQQNTQKYSGMAANLSLNPSQTKWMLDSEATDHITKNGVKSNVVAGPAANCVASTKHSKIFWYGC
jgi:hypothetical protein